MSERIKELERRVAQLERDERSANDPPPYDQVQYWTCEGCGEKRLAALHQDGEIVIQAGRARVRVPTGEAIVTCYRCGRDNRVRALDEGERFVHAAASLGVEVVHRGR